jgi:pimeloyl-ACP methyl ester carboxylesterase
MWLDVQGQRAYAYTGGRVFDPALPTVVFIHGAQNDHSVWILQSRYLAHHGHGVLAVDLPGHGRSAGEPLADIEALARWLIALLDAAGVERATLVGHSMGSLIALECSGLAPARLAGLVLVGTAVPMKVSDALLDAARTDEQKAFDMINAWSHQSLNHHPGTPGPGFSVFVQNRRLMERQAPGVLHTDFSACNAYQQGLARAQALQVPTLFVLGQRDVMTPARSGKTLAAQVKQAQVVEIEDCGHALQSERPQQVLEAIVRFLAQQRAPA